jgi:DNA polymerase V
VYLVKVEGDSVQGAGIYGGDIVIVDRSVQAEHDDIVVASINCEPVCKRLYKRGETVILKTENPKYPPRHVLEGDDLVIWGVVKYGVRDHDHT